MMQLCPSFLRTKPCIPELDFAGVVTEIGGGVDKSRELKVGSPVFGSIPVPEHLKGSGALGEYVAVGADCVSRVPDGVELREAAGLPVAGCTALCLMDKAGLRLRDKVLVNGAAGGIGSLATQMVRRAVGDEGYLVAVCSGENEGFVRELGANEVRHAVGVLIRIQLGISLLSINRPSIVGRRCLRMRYWQTSTPTRSSTLSSTHTVRNHCLTTAPAF